MKVAYSTFPTTSPRCVWQLYWLNIDWIWSSLVGWQGKRNNIFVMLICPDIFFTRNMRGRLTFRVTRADVRPLVILRFWHHYFPWLMSSHLWGAYTKHWKIYTLLNEVTGEMDQLCFYLKTYAHLYGLLQCLLKSLCNISFGSWLFDNLKKVLFSPQEHAHICKRKESIYSFLQCGRLTWCMHMTQVSKGLLQSTGWARVRPLRACGGSSWVTVLSTWGFVLTLCLYFISLCPFMAKTIALACFSLIDCPQPLELRHPLRQLKAPGSALASDLGTG